MAYCKILSVKLDYKLNSNWNLDPIFTEEMEKHTYEEGTQILMFEVK